VGRTDIKLTPQDYFLLGTLAEETDGTGQLPYGCTDEQAERLAQRGYLVRAVFRDANEQEMVSYRITAKGRATWRAYRFIEDPPDGAEPK
jgi:hypothetical protein